MIADDAIRAGSGRAFDAGVPYQVFGRGEHVRTTTEGGGIAAPVRGMARQPYVQSVQVTCNGRDASILDRGGLHVPVGFNCKHLAAALIGYQRQVSPSYRYLVLVEHCKR